MDQNTTFYKLFNDIRAEADGVVYESMEYEVYELSAEHKVDKNITRIIERVVFSQVIQPVLTQTYDFYDYELWIDL